MSWPGVYTAHPAPHMPNRVIYPHASPAFVSAVQLRGGRKTLREAERIPIIENIASAPVLQDKYPHRSPLEHMGGGQWQHCQSSPEERHGTAALMPGLWFVYASNGGGGRRLYRWPLKCHYEVERHDTETLSTPRPSSGAPRARTESCQLIEILGTSTRQIHQNQQNADRVPDADRTLSKH
ncbi:hypothetical protein BKA56DRAFT_669964 [Ilyonectria sp. MPI-CAGE-AT-0026]|nr:hypothetical protein BKA56DRAFT_669964 [Ilyonectria sp. MPI-CAGE-AT-0026]